MKVAIFFGLVAVCAAAPATFVINSGFAHPLTYAATVAVIPSKADANLVIEPEFAEKDVASKIIPTTYSAGTFGAAQGQFFGGLPGVYVRKDGVAPVAPVVSVAHPMAYAAHPMAYAAHPMTYAAHPMAYANTMTYSAAAALPIAAHLPKTVQQNEGARLMTF